MAGYLFSIFPASDDELKYLKNNHAGGRCRRDSEYPVNHYLKYNAEIDGFNTAGQVDSQTPPTAAWVVETGSPGLEASNTLEAAAKSTENPRLLVGDVILVPMLSITR
jgi:hypothetical protein